MNDNTANTETKQNIEPNDEALREMYLAFRKTMDNYCFPLIKEWATKQKGFITLYDDNDDKDKRKPVGFLIVIDDYVDGIYVIPEHRRKGIAKKAVMDYLKRGGVITRLHIIRTNTPALNFWKSIFVLEPENDCPVDVLYRVIRRKEHEQGISNKQEILR